MISCFHLLVFLGAGLGGTARYGINVFAARLSDSASFVGTVGINVLGCLLIGLLAANLATSADPPEPMRLLLGTGVLGGFTTFSAFSLDAATLWQRGQPTAAAAYVLASVVLSLLAFLLGHGLGRQLA
jgi:CrcB protein